MWVDLREIIPDNYMAFVISQEGTSRYGNDVLSCGYYQESDFNISNLTYSTCSVKSMNDIVHLCMYQAKQYIKDSKTFTCEIIFLGIVYIRSNDDTLKIFFFIFGGVWTPKTPKNIYFCYFLMGSQ